MYVHHMSSKTILDHLTCFNITMIGWSMYTSTTDITLDYNKTHLAIVTSPSNNS